jgi:hypothetical protein
MRRKKKKLKVIGKVKLMTFQKAIEIAVNRMKADMLRRGCKAKTVNDDMTRIRRFITDYCSMGFTLAWTDYGYENYQFYLENFFSCQVKGSAGYVRRMKSVFNRLSACLPPYQLGLKGVL